MGLIYLDACILIYLIEGHPEFGPRLQQAMAAAEETIWAISPLVKMECLVMPIRREDPILLDAFEAHFRQYRLFEMPEAVYLQAARLRARFRLRTPDALHLACAQIAGCEALWTNDDRLLAASHGLARKVV